MIKKINKLNSEGYQLHVSFDISSSDRGIDWILKSENIKSIDEFTLDHPKVVEKIEKLSNYLKKENKFDSLDPNGEWLVYSSHNDIGWVFISVGWFTFEESSELVKCEVEFDGIKTKMFLKCIFGKNKKTYFDANDTLFKGDIIAFLSL